MNTTTEKPIHIMDCEMAFAIPGQDGICDVINPRTGLSWHYGHNLEQMREKYPGCEIVNFEDHCKAHAGRQESPIEWEETTAERFNDMLEVLPPAAWHGGGFMVGEPYDHHATSGKPRFQAYRKKDGKYFAASRPMTFTEFCAIFGKGPFTYSS